MQKIGAIASGLANRRGLRIPVLLILAALNMDRANAAEFALVPHTQIAIVAAQWVEADGTFRHWPELEGDFTISGDGTIQLPMVGTIAAAGRTPPEVAAAIAKNFAQKIGLNSAPEVVVTVTAYPPLYVVGDVKSPGQYPFTPGVSVLKALALGGGMFRPENGAVEDQVALVGEQEDLVSRTLRTEARIARLDAEARGADRIVFPDSLSEIDPALAREITAEETSLFEGRATGIRRQRAALDELQEARPELDKLRAQLNVSQRKLSLIRSELGAGDMRDLIYSIIRSNGEGQETIAATEATMLSPGDILKVETPRSQMLARPECGPLPAGPQQFSSITNSE